MSFEDDGPLAFDGAKPDSSAPEDVSGVGKAAVLLLFGAAGSYVLYRTVVNRPDSKLAAEAAATTTTTTTAAPSEIQAKLADAKGQRRARVHALRNKKIHLHQFEYAWAAQAHLRMANANFDEHNVRFVAPTQCLLICILAARVLDRGVSLQHLLLRIELVCMTAGIPMPHLTFHFRHLCVGNTLCPPLR